MKKNKKANKIGSFVSKLLIALTIIMFIILLYLNILPMKYYLYSLIGVIVVELLLIFLMNARTKKKIKIVSIFISILLSITYILGLFYIFRTFDFINNIGRKDYTYEEYYIVSKENTSLSKDNI